MKILINFTKIKLRNLFIKRHHNEKEKVCNTYNKRWVSRLSSRTVTHKKNG